MGKAPGSLSSSLLNVALVVLVLVVGVLVYALATRYFAARVDPIRDGDATADLRGDIIQVEVRNGCGVSGLAGTATRYLRERGFDVVEAGDHTSFDVAQSVVIDRVGMPELARKVALALGLPEDRVRQDVRPDYYLDASVIIGKDYEMLRPFSETKP